MVRWIECYIFVDDGVYKMAPDFHVNEFKIFVWTLVDSDQAPDGVPPELVRNRTRLFVLYASSPNKSTVGNASIRPWMISPWL
jgi:hypothetical protein